MSIQPTANDAIRARAWYMDDANAPEMTPCQRLIRALFLTAAGTNGEFIVAQAIETYGRYTSAIVGELALERAYSHLACSAVDLWHAHDAEKGANR